jgi:biotin operon repressor
MSHVSNVELTVTDLDALQYAVEQTDGLTFCEGQKTYKWYGKWMNDFHGSSAAVDNGFNAADFGKSEHAIKVEGAEYEIGVVKNPNGDGYRLLYDNYDSGRKIAKRYGAGLEAIKNSYAERVAVKQLQRKGYRVSTRVNAQGQRQVIGVKS